MYCSYCNNVVNESDTFCTNCGHKIETEPINESVSIRLNNTVQSFIITIPLPSNYVYQMNQNILTVYKEKFNSGNTTLGHFIAEFNKFEEITYENSNMNIIEKNNVLINNKKAIMLVTIGEDRQVHTSYTIKLNEYVCLVLELNKIGATSKEEYQTEECYQFLNLLTNSTIFDEKQEIFNEELEKSNSNINSAEVIKEIKKISSTEKTLLIFMGLFILAGIVLLFIESYKDFAFIPGILGVVGLLPIFIAKRIISYFNLKKIDFNILKNEIDNNCFEIPSIKTYFTDNYIISNYYHSIVYKYDDILWIYAIDKYYEDHMIGKDLGIFLKKGKKTSIPFDEEFIDIICRKNPHILKGNTSENKKKYKELKKAK